MTKLHKKTPQYSSFAVLKASDIPSILVETGFISNPGEAKKLATSSYQNKMAREIFYGLTGYFYQEPPEGSYIAWKKQGGNNAIASSKAGKSTKRYTIKRGDTLSQIAQKYKVSVTDIRRLNGIKNNSIQVGQRIKLPAS